MNLTELQIQLRSIEEQLSMLQGEIEKMKPQPEDEKRDMLEKITGMAAKFPLNYIGCTKIPASEVKAYISCLAYILLADEDKLYEKLLYLCRLACGMGFSASAENILQMGMETDKKYFDKAYLELKPLKYSLLTDALILVNITQEASDASFSLIADMAATLDCDKEDLRAAAYVAKAVLMKDSRVLQQLPVPGKNRWMGQFRQHIPAPWIESQRVFCGEIYMGTWHIAMGTLSTCSCVIKIRLPAGTIVKKGEILVSYEETTERPLAALFATREPEKQTKSINAPCDGVVFFAEGERYELAWYETRKTMSVYVVSYFDNYEDFCQWLKKK